MTQQACRQIESSFDRLCRRVDDLAAAADTARQRANALSRTIAAAGRAQQEAADRLVASAQGVAAAAAALPLAASTAADQLGQAIHVAGSQTARALDEARAAVESSWSAVRSALADSDAELSRARTVQQQEGNRSIDLSRDLLAVRQQLVAGLAVAADRSKHIHDVLEQHQHDLLDPADEAAARTQSLADLTALVMRAAVAGVAASNDEVAGAVRLSPQLSHLPDSPDPAGQYLLRLAAALARQAPDQLSEVLAFADWQAGLFADFLARLAGTPSGRPEATSLQAIFFPTEGGSDHVAR